MNLETWCQLDDVLETYCLQAHRKMSFSCMLRLSSLQLLDTDLPTLPFCLSISAQTWILQLLSSEKPEIETSVVVSENYFNSHL